MNGSLVAVAVGATLVACQAPPAVPVRETTTVGGANWTIDLPVDLGLREQGAAANATFGIWTATDGSGVFRAVTVLIVPEAVVPLERYADSLRVNSGARLRRLEPVAMPVGRAFLAQVSNGDAPDSHTVMVELEPGLVISIALLGLTAEDAVAIARSFRRSSP